MTTWITVCNTCRRGEPDDSAEGATDGQEFFALIDTEAATALKVKSRSVACLMGCGHACNVAVQADGKFQYVLGGFEPTRESAMAVVEYAAKHADSESGVVPYKQWPEGVKGRFISRTPPAPNPENSLA